MALQLAHKCLRITIMEWPPLSVKFGPHYGGIAVDVIRLVAELNRLCLEFIAPPDQIWGMEYPNGSWNGMIGQINRTEADMSGTLIFISEPRAEVVDFSTPLFFQEHRILYRVPKVKPNIAGFLQPFTPTVWVTVTAVVIAVSILLALLFKLYDTDWGFKRQNTALAKGTAREPGWKAARLAVGALLTQSLSWKPNPAKLILLTTGLWMFMSFVMGVMYKSNLQSMIILQKTQVPFDTVEQLVNQDEYKPIMGGGGSLHQKALESPPNSVLGRLIRKMKISNNFSEVFHLVTFENYAGIANQIQLEVAYHLYYSQNAMCVHTITKTGFVTGMQMSFVFQKNSPLKPKFDKIIHHLREAGLLDYMLGRALSNASHCRKKVKKSNELRPLAFWDVAGMISVFIGGIVISLFSFSYELFRNPDNVPPPLRDPLRKIVRSEMCRKRCGAGHRSPLPPKNIKIPDDFKLMTLKRKRSSP